jgi:phospholipase/carboxylesterase
MKEKDQLGFSHRFLASDHNNPENLKKSMTLLILHGTGGNENDLVPIAKMIGSAGASILSPRGKVLENGMPRFFRRLSEGVFDASRRKSANSCVRNFKSSISESYGFSLGQTVAIGYSNGANIAASMLLLRPEVLAGAILFRAMVPFIPEPIPNLSSKLIFMSSGLHDPIVPSRGTKDLFHLLRKTGSNVSLEWQNSGHELTQRDLSEARAWLSASFIT